MRITLTCCGWPLKPVVVFILPFLSLCTSLNVSANCLKEIKFRIVETRTHAIEQGIDIQSLPTEDLLRGKGEVLYFDVHICIDNNGYVQRTTTRLEQDNSFYPSPVFKLVLNASGINAYKKDGSLISSLPPTSESTVDIPGFEIPLTQEQINAYGLNSNLNLINQDFSHYFSSVQSTSWTAGDKSFYSSDELDVIVSPQDLYYLISNYDHAGDLQSMQAHTYQMRSGYIIPQFEVRHEYQDITSGHLQSTTQKTYLSYEVVQDDKTILSHVASDHVPSTASVKQKAKATTQTQFSTFVLPKRITPQVNLYPNPTQDFVNINFDKSWQSFQAQWQIINAAGTIMLTGKKMRNDTKMNINVQGLNAGVYTFKIQNTHRNSSQPFVLIK